VYKQRNTKTRQAVYNNVTLRRVRVTIVTVERQKVLHILKKCMLYLLTAIGLTPGGSIRSYLPCKAHVPY